MPSLVMDSCCFCINVRTGSFIIGYLQLVGEIIFAIGGLMFFVLGSAVVADSTHTKSREGDDVGQAFGVVIIILGGLLLLFVAILLAFTIVLLVGLHKEKRGLVKAFLIYYAVFLGVMVVLFIASLFNTFDVRTAISSVLEILLQIYFFLVIRSHYYKMDDGNTKGVVYRTA